jgi:tetratricopeptide (TPR) repeat protein
LAFILIPALLWSICSGCSHPPQILWKHNLAEALAEARSAKRLIITDLSIWVKHPLRNTNWYRAEKLTNDKIWADPRVIQESRKYVFLKLNAQFERDGVALTRRLTIHTYPAVIILDSDGNELERMEGYLSAEQFLERLNKIISDPESLGNLEAQEAANPNDLSLAFKVGQKLSQRSSFQQAQMRFEKILESDPKNKTHLADWALYNLALCQSNWARDLVFVEAQQSEREIALATIDRLRKAYPQSLTLPSAAVLSGEILIGMGQMDRARAELEDFFKRYPGSDLNLIRQAGFLMNTLKSLKP